MAEVVDQIKKCEGLTTLQLSGNSFGVEPTKAIGECLAHKPTFTRALWSDMFVSRLKSEIPISLVRILIRYQNLFEILTFSKLILEFVKST